MACRLQYGTPRARAKWLWKVFHCIRRSADKVHRTHDSVLRTMYLESIGCQEYQVLYGVNVLEIITGPRLVSDPWAIFLMCHYLASWLNVCASCECECLERRLCFVLQRAVDAPLLRNTSVLCRLFAYVHCQRTTSSNSNTTLMLAAFLLCFCRIRCGVSLLMYASSDGSARLLICSSICNLLFANSNKYIHGEIRSSCSTWSMHHQYSLPFYT